MVVTMVEDEDVSILPDREVHPATFSFIRIFLFYILNYLNRVNP